MSVLLTILTAYLCGCKSKQTKALTLRLSNAVLVVMVNPPTESHLASPRLLCAFWSSGDVVWSLNRSLGGEPLLHSDIGTHTLRSAAEHLTRMIGDARGDSNPNVVSLNLPSYEILVRTEQGEATLESGTDFFNENERRHLRELLAASASRESAREEPQGSKLGNARGDFISQWQDLWGCVQRLIPTDGSSFDSRFLEH